MSTMRRWFRMALLVLLSACGGGADRSTEPTPDPADAVPDSVHVWVNAYDVLTGEFPQNAMVLVEVNGTFVGAGYQRLPPGTDGVVHVYPYDLFYEATTVPFTVPDSTTYTLQVPLMPKSLTLMGTEWYSDFDSTVYRLHLKYPPGLAGLAIDSIRVLVERCVRSSGPPINVCIETDTADVYLLHAPAWEWTATVGDTLGIARFSLRRPNWPTYPDSNWSIAVSMGLHDSLRQFTFGGSVPTLNSRSQRPIPFTPGQRPR
jgi:hypothetical protein